MGAHQRYGTGLYRRPPAVRDRAFWVSTSDTGQACTADSACDQTPPIAPCGRGAPAIPTRRRGREVESPPTPGCRTVSCAIVGGHRVPPASAVSRQSATVPCGAWAAYG